MELPQMLRKDSGERRRIETFQILRVAGKQIPNIATRYRAITTLV